MLTLKLFGPPAVQAAGGLVSGRAAQGHRLALLAVLALARGRPVGRDRLVALLWPESSTERARHQLSDALYIVRNALGADVVRTAGDELLLNAEAATSDVGAFERLLDDWEPAAAVALFTGPLLDGVHLADGAEFEHWLEVERVRLGQRCAAALEALAETSEQRGDFAGAAAWWRRLAAHDPYGGRVALRLMRALEAAGDRAGALRHARIHTTLLREEFDAEPDPDVTAFAERLRTGPSARAAPEPVVVAATANGPPAALPVAPGGDAAPGTDPPPALSTASPSPAPAPRRWAARAAAAAGALVAVLVLVVASNGGVPRGRATPAPAARSLAVLPFENMSPDPANGYFSDGLSEQIITVLSRVEGLRVAARTSSFALRDAGLDMRVIGDTLGVETVLEGSVRREGSRLRVTAQLIDAGNGYHLWSGEYDREAAEVLAVQDEIARAIAAALALRLPPRAVLARVPPAPQLEAYDLYLRALHLRNELSDDALRRALDLLDRAIELEPGFALAHAARASVVAPRIYFGNVPLDQGMRDMRISIARAFELDPALGEAHVALGILRLFFEWDWAGAEQSLRQAIRLNPSDAHAWHHLANHLHAMGRFVEAREARAHGVALDPLNARTRIVLAMDHLRAGELEEGFAQIERAQRLDPMNPLLLGLGPSIPAIARLHLARGRPEDAVQGLLRVAALRGATAAEVDAMRDAVAEGGMPGFWRRWLAMDQRQADGTTNPFRIALLWMCIGDAGRALDWIERAYGTRDPGLIYLASEQLFTPLHADPRFARIVREMRLPLR